MSTSVACPNCGTLSRAGAKFCGRCGNALPLPAAPSYPNLLGSHTGRLPEKSLVNGRYVIVRVIGRGGMGAVYLVTDTLDQNRVLAMKEMSNAAIPDATDRAMAVGQFRREAELLRRLRHPNLPAVSDEFTLDDRHYLVMEYVPGSTLQQMLDRGEGPFAESRIAYWATQLCDVLDYLHRQQPPIIFRDLKPSNIMIMADDRVKLIDFGIARLFKPGQRQDTMLLGTHGYAAPEQYGGGQSDARSDIYALGATLFSLLTGQDPGQFDPLKPLPSISRYRPDVSPHLESVVMRATRVNAAERWQSTQELRTAIATGPLPARGPTQIVAPTPPPQPRPAGLPPTVPATPGAPKTHRVTTRLLMRAAGLSNRQLAIAGLVALLAIIGSIWLLTPLLEGSWLWYNVPFLTFVAPFAYAATRRRFVAGIAQFAVAVIGGWLVWARLPNEVSSVSGLLGGALLSAVVIELMIYLLPRIVGRRTRDDPGAWQREAVWLGLAAVLGYIVLQWPANGIAMAFNGVAWVFAFLLGVAGWFVGDLVQGYIYLKQTGMKRQ